jgi:hypothetical protein
MKIITNNVPRDLIDAYELTPAERADFDYHDWDAIDKGNDSATFIRYKGDLLDLGNFTRTEIPGWDGISADTFFSGTVIRYVEDNERVIVGRVLT